MYLLGTASQASIGRLGKFEPFNRAMTAAELASHFKSGVAAIDRSASATPTKTFSFSAGTDGLVGSGGTLAGNIDGIGGVDNTCRLTATTTNSTRFVLQNFAPAGFRTKTKIRVYRPASNVGATGLLVGALTGNSTNAVLGTAVQIPADTWTTIDIGHVGTGVQDTWVLYFTNSVGTSSGFSSGDIFYIESGGTITRLGQTASLQPTGIQLAPGQWLDQHPNAKHVIIPDGARLADQKVEGVLRGINVFSASTTGQHIIGANLNALPLNARLTLSAIATVSGTFDIGDGVDQDRYAAGVTIGTTWSDITMLTRFHDATNRKIVLTPTSSYTGTVTSAARVERLA